MKIEIYDLDKKEKIADFEDLTILNASLIELEGQAYIVKEKAYKANRSKETYSWVIYVVACKLNVS